MPLDESVLTPPKKPGLDPGALRVMGMDPDVLPEDERRAGTVEMADPQAAARWLHGRLVQKARWRRYEDDPQVRKAFLNRFRYDPYPEKLWEQIRPVFGKLREAVEKDEEVILRAHDFARSGGRHVPDVAEEDEETFLRYVAQFSEPRIRDTGAVFGESFRRMVGDVLGGIESGVKGAGTRLLAEVAQAPGRLWRSTETQQEYTDALTRSMRWWLGWTTKRQRQLRLQHKAQSIVRAADPNVSVSGGLRSELVTQVGRAIESGGPMIATAGLAATPGGQPAAFGTWATMTAGRTYRRMKGQGLNDADAASVAALHGAFDAYIEMAQIRGLLPQVLPPGVGPSLWTRFASGVKTLGKEVLLEELPQGFGEVATQLYAQEHGPLSDEQRISLLDGLEDAWRQAQDSVVPLMMMVGGGKLLAGEAHTAQFDGAMSSMLSHPSFAGVRQALAKVETPSRRAVAEAMFMKPADLPPLFKQANARARLVHLAKQVEGQAEALLQMDKAAQSIEEQAHAEEARAEAEEAGAEEGVQAREPEVEEVRVRDAEGHRVEAPPRAEEEAPREAVAEAPEAAMEEGVPKALLDKFTPPPEGERPEGAPPDLEAMKRDELRQMAKDKGIERTLADEPISRANKADVIRAIDNAEMEREATTAEKQPEPEPREAAQDRRWAHYTEKAPPDVPRAWLQPQPGERERTEIWVKMPGRDQAVHAATLGQEGMPDTLTAWAGNQAVERAATWWQSQDRAHLRALREQLAEAEESGAGARVTELREQIEALEAEAEAKTARAAPTGQAMAAVTEGPFRETALPEPTEPASPAEVREEAKALCGAVDEFNRILRPARRSKLTRQATLVFQRFMIGQPQLRYNRMDRALGKFRRMFWGKSKEEVLAFWDAIETGQTEGLPAKQRVLAEALRKRNDQLFRDITSYPEAETLNYIVNHYPHSFKDPDKARDALARILGRRPMEGPKSFLKKRTRHTMREAIEEGGLEPLTWNPVDLWLHRYWEAQRWMAARDTMRELRERGWARFKFGFQRGPAHWALVDDPMFTEYARPDMDVKEAFDAKLVEQVVQIARSLGAHVERRVRIGGRSWGYAQGAWKMVTRVGGPETVLTHELGHIVDNGYGLYEWMVNPHGETKRDGTENQADARRKRARIKAQLRALADLRFEGLEPTEATRRAVRAKGEKGAVMIQALVHAPDKFREVAPDVYARLVGFLNQHEKLRPLLEVKPSLVLAEQTHKVSMPGVTILGHHWVPAPVAELLNNLLGRGLWQHKYAAVRKGYEAWRVSSNALIQAQHAFSGFHVLNTTFDGPNTQFSLGLREVFGKWPGEKGDFRRILRGLYKMTTSPIAAVGQPILGQRLKLAAESEHGEHTEEMVNIINLLEAAGAGTRMSARYRNEHFKALANTMAELGDAETFAQKTGIALKTPHRVALATLQAVSIPVMEWTVPAQKLGAFAVMMRHEMERLGTTDPTDPRLWHMASTAYDSVENRMGQLDYNRLFWDRTFRDALFMAVRSVGWNWGSLREFGGAVVDLFTIPQRMSRGDAWLSHRMAYTMAATIHYYMGGAVLGYLLTGEWPKEIYDAFFVPTGRTLPDGTPERLRLPTYAKDWVAWYKAPVASMMHKLNPVATFLSDVVLENEDYFKVEIRHPGDPWHEQAMDVFKYAAEQFMPFSFRNFAQQRKAGAPVSRALSAIIGIIPAPLSVIRTRATQRAIDLAVKGMPRGTRTKEQWEKSQARKKLIHAIQAGEDISQLPEFHMFSAKELQRIGRMSGQSFLGNMFKRLTLKDALTVYEVASDAEREELRPMLIYKVQHYDEGKTDWPDLARHFALIMETEQKETKP